jgi:hypothetical protein
MTQRRWIQVGGGVVLLAGIAAAVVAQSLPQAAGAGDRGANHPAPNAAGSAVSGHEETRPLGTWERNIGPMHITLTFTPAQLKGQIVLKKEGKKAVIDFRADYSVSRDNVLYGIVTSASAGISGKLDADAQDVLKGQAKMALEVIDQPFSMRYRLDDDSLTVKDIRFHLRFDDNGQALGRGEENPLTFGLGLYTRKVAARSATHSQ